MKKRFMSMLLVLCMVFTLLPSVAFAAETGGVTIGNTAIGTSSVTEGAPLCENHKVHDKDCGYIEAKDAQPCGHLNEDGGYSCAPVKDSGDVSGNTATPGDAEEKYVCDHSDGCGYIEAKDGADCTHECELCIADDAYKDVSPASLSATPRAADNGYSYDPTTTTLTIVANEGTTAWRDNQSIIKENVTTVVMESSVTEIGYSTFSGCTNLASVTIPSGVTAIGIGAFSSCTKLDSVTFADGSELETIGNEAFSGCTSLASMTIPESVTTIGDAAFYECSSLESVTIPSSVAEISSRAFHGCTILASVTFEGETPPAFGSEVFKSTHADLKIYVPSASVNNYKAVSNLADYVSNIEADITSNGYSYDPDSKTLTIDSNEGTIAWRSNSSITKADVTTVEIKAGVTEIGEVAFMDCHALENVDIPASVASIDKSAFYKCTGLVSVTIPENVTSIGETAFYGCTSLASMTIPESVTTIGEAVFAGCTSLASVTFEGATPPATFGPDVFHNTPDTLKIYVPKDSVDDYKAVSNLVDYTNNIVAKSDPITGTGYSYDPDSKALTIDSNEGTTAWIRDSSISDVTKVVIKSGVTAIGRDAFSGCTSLDSVSIPGSVISIGEYAFYNCIRLDGVTIPSGVTTIDNYAFSGCGSLDSVTIPSSVTKIGNSALYGCGSLESVTFAEDSELETIGSEAFYNCANLARVIIPESVGSIGGQAFYGCTSLTSITIPEGVTNIGGSAFNQCRKLARVIFERATPPTIGPNVFYNTNIGLKIYVPKNSVQEYKKVSNLSSYASSIVAKSDTIIGVGYSYDPDSKTLTIFSSEGTTAWSAFGNSISLPDVTKVVIESGVTKIGDNAFNLCNNLANVTIPSSVTSIGDKAFGGCTILANVTIPSNVTTIGKNAFSQCVNLASVTFEGATPPSFGTEVFTSTPSTLKIYVPSADAVTAYKAVPNLATWKNSIARTGKKWDVRDIHLETMLFPGDLLDLNICARFININFMDGLTNYGQTWSAFVDGAYTPLFTYEKALEDGVTTPIPEGTRFIGWKVTKMEGECTESLCPLFNQEKHGAEVIDLEAVYESINAPTTKITTTLDLSSVTADMKCTDSNVGTIITGQTQHTHTDNKPCWAWNNNNKTLTLNNVDIEVSGTASKGIKLPSSLVTISLTPSTENKVTAGGSGFYPIWASEDLTITGAGKLIAACTSGENTGAIISIGDINITGGAEVVATHNGTTVEGANGKAISTNDGNITIDGATVTAESEVGISANKDLTIKSSTVNATGTDLYGIGAMGNLSIQDSTITAGSTNFNAIFGGNTRALSGSKVTATTGTGKTPFNKEPTLSNDMVHKDGTGTWDNTAGTACVYEKGTAATVTAVTISPKTASVQKGNTQQFNVAVTGTNNPAQTVTWEVTGGSKPETTINANGLLTVAADETATSLTVTATSTADTSKSDTAIVTVTTTPVAKYALTVTGGTGGGDFEENATVIITANIPATGKVFDKWTTADGVTFGDANAATTTITMPAKAVTVTATYKDEAVTVPVTGVTLNKSTISLYSNTNPRSETLTATVAPSNAIHKAVTWSSSNLAVATVANGTVTAVANGTATITVTTADGGFTASCTVTVSTYSSGGSTGSDGGGSSSGGSSSSGSSNIIVTPPAPDKPNTPTEAEIKVEGKTDENGNTTITVTDKNITDAIAKAEADAKKNGNTANGITIVLSATGGKNATNVTVNLPKTVQDTIISKKVVSTIIVVDNPDVQIGMDLKAVTEINTQAKSDVNITAQRLDSSKLTGTAQTAIGSRPVFDLAVNIASATGNSSGKQVQSFGAGGMSVTIPYTLGANEKAGNVCAVYVDGSGKVQWLTSSVYDSTAKVLRFSTNHFSTYGVGYKQDAPAFTDIADHWAKADMEYVVSRGLFAGTGDTTFSPDTAMTRGMFVTALGRLANADVSSYKTSSFGDVKADSYYMGYIEWANKNNIMNGTGDGTFSPDQPITREQMAAVMYNYAGLGGGTMPKVYEENIFADSTKISEYARNAVKFMQMAGVLRGKSGNVFDPQGTATRAEVSAVLRRFVELRISIDTAQGWTMNHSGKWMYYENGKPVTGKKDIDGVSYTFDQNGEVADIPKELK